MLLGILLESVQLAKFVRTKQRKPPKTPVLIYTNIIDVYANSILFVVEHLAIACQMSRNITRMEDL